MKSICTGILYLYHNWWIQLQGFCLNLKLENTFTRPHFQAPEKRATHAPNWTQVHSISNFPLLLWLSADKSQFPFPRWTDCRELGTNVPGTGEHSFSAAAGGRPALAAVPSISCRHEDFRRAHRARDRLPRGGSPVLAPCLSFQKTAPRRLQELCSICSPSCPCAGQRAA